jgi:hypothetical protein
MSVFLHKGQSVYSEINLASRPSVTFDHIGKLITPNPWYIASKYAAVDLLKI